MKFVINNIDALIEVVSIGRDLDFDRIRPHLRTAQLVVGRFTSPALLEELGAAVESGQLTQAQRELKDYARVPIGNLATLRYMSAINAQITDLGVHRTIVGEQKDAFEWQFKGVADQLTQDAWDGLEELLRFLEKNVDDYPTYQNSDEAKMARQFLIRSATVFNQYHEIGSSRLTFQTLLPSMRMAERELIRPALGSQYAPLLAEAGLTAEQKELLDVTRQALVYATLARALRERLVQVGPAGVQVSLTRLVITQAQPATDDQLEKAITYYEKEAQKALSALQTQASPPQEPTEKVLPRGDKIVSLF